MTRKNTGKAQLSANPNSFLARVMSNSRTTAKVSSPVPRGHQEDDEVAAINYGSGYGFVVSNASMSMSLSKAAKRKRKK